MSIALALAAGGLTATRTEAAAVPRFEYNIISTKNLSGATTVAPGEFAAITFSVTNPQTGARYDLKSDPAWTQTASGNSRLFLQIGWNTRDITNTNSGSNTVLAGAPRFPYR